MNNNINMRKKLVMCVLTISYFFCISHIFFLGLSKDDAAMRNIVTGNMTGINEAHVNYLNYIYSKVIAVLYGLIENINWYGIIEIFSFMLFFYCVSIHISRLWNKSRVLCCIIWLIFVIIFAIVTTPMLIEMNFTYVADMFGGVAIVSLIMATEEDLKKKSVWIKVLVCLVICYWIRSEVFFTTIPYIALVLFWLLIKKKININKIVIVGLIFFALIYVSKWINYSAYQYEWSNLRQYSDAKAILFDFYGWPDYDECKDIYQRYNVDREAAALFDKKCYVIDNADVSELFVELAAYQEQKNSEISLSYKIRTVLSTLIYYFTNSDFVLMHYIILTLLIINCLYGAKIGGYTYSLYLICSAAFYVLCAAYLVFIGRTIERAVVGIQFLLIVFLGMQIIKNMCETLSDKKGYYVPYLILFFIIVGYAAWTDLGENQLLSNKLKDRDRICSDIRDYTDSNKDNLYIISDGYYAFDIENSINERKYCHNILSLSGWQPLSKIWKDVLNEYNVKILWKDMLYKSNIYYIDCKNTNTEKQKQQIEAYYKEKYGAIKWVTVYEKEEYKIIKPVVR